MKKIYYTSIFALAALFLTSCGAESPKEEESNEPEEKVCFYSYNEESTEMNWTAFKFNEKAPVGGTFKEINVEGTMKSDDPMELLKSLSFDIPVASIESMNEERNGKIVEHFFGTIATENLKGKMVSLSDDGQAVLEVTMNNIAKEFSGDYTFEDGKFDFSATIDVANWEANMGIDALNKICNELHTGKDGVSKLWSEVDLTFSTTLESDCD